MPRFKCADVQAVTEPPSRYGRSGRTGRWPWKLPRAWPDGHLHEDPLMPLRSLLFVPGDSESKLAGGASRGADALILDLEDSVAPSRKTVARQLVASYLANPARNRDLRCLVRINAIPTG